MDHYFDNPLPLKLYPVRPSTQPQPTAAPIIRHSNQGSNATLTWPWGWNDRFLTIVAT